MRTQPVIAYRIWKVSPEGRLSTAYRNSGKWPWMKPYSSTCDGGDTKMWWDETPVTITGAGDKPKADHDAPHFDCTCGLYGYKSVKCLEQTFEQFYKGNCVLGCVALWGRITEHTDGYRAEYGYPQVLYTPNEGLGEPGLIIKHTSLYENVQIAAQKYGIDTAPLPEEIKVAFSRFVEKKRLEEEKKLKKYGLWVDEAWPVHQKSIDDFYKPGFLQRYLKGNI